MQREKYLPAGQLTDVFVRFASSHNEKAGDIIAPASPPCFPGRHLSKAGVQARLGLEEDISRAERRPGGKDGR